MTDADSLNAAIHEEVALQAYDPAWPAGFVAERDRLLALFPVCFIDIEHIGSTAVPGLLAKPVNDILAGVGSMAVARALTGPLLEAGYGTSADIELSKAAGFGEHLVKPLNGVEPLAAAIARLGAGTGPDETRFG